MTGEQSSLRVELLRQTDDLAVLELAGELDILTCAQLKDCLAEATEEDVTHVVVDLAAVDFIDSAALGVLMGCGRVLDARDASLTIICRANHVARVLKVTGIDHIFPVHTLD
jgi:anti-sigma B factor antagonist